jgi:glycosyltransferase involved in cell wall biosynthesis
LRRTEVISFHQHFPDVEAIASSGGSASFYIDATYTQLFPSYGLDRSMDRRTIRDTLEAERRTYAMAGRVVANQSWALRSLQSDYGLPADRCAMILPGANYPVYPGLRPEPTGRAGIDRPFVMGFIGKDWRRKGLPFLDQVAVRLRAAGWRVTVRAMGYPVADAPAGAQVESLGFIDKRTQFGPFLHSCDLGCLFSSAEAAGTAVLEFLGVGVPVVGFTVNGLADLLPADAGFRFPLGTDPADAAGAIGALLADESQQARFIASARRLAPFLQWDRCVAEFIELWATGTLAAPFRINPERAG